MPEKLKSLHARRYYQIILESEVTFLVQISKCDIIISWCSKVGLSLKWLSMMIGLGCKWPASHCVSWAFSKHGLMWLVYANTIQMKCEPPVLKWFWKGSLFHYSFPMIENVWSFSQPTGIAEIFLFQLLVLPNTKLGNFFYLSFFLIRKTTQQEICMTYELTSDWRKMLKN